MKSLLVLVTALALVLPLSIFGAFACSGRGARPGEPAVVVGTVLDASTGQGVAGIRVEGPFEACAVSDERGRFEMTGLRAGDAGELAARSPDGRRGSVTLRPLAPGRLEVVLHLARR
jgi:hypothetical protein